MIICIFSTPFSGYANLASQDSTFSLFQEVLLIYPIVKKGKEHTCSYSFDHNSKLGISKIMLPTKTDTWSQSLSLGTLCKTILLPNLIF